MPDELHLYVEFSQPNADTNPVDWMSVDDFLTWRPKGALHKRARDGLVSLLCKALTERQNQKSPPAGANGQETIDGRGFLSVATSLSCRIDRIDENQRHGAELPMIHDQRLLGRTAS